MFKCYIVAYNKHHRYRVKYKDKHKDKKLNVIYSLSE